MQRRSPNTALLAWTALGVLAYLLLPWYALQDGNGLTAIGRVFAGADTANGVLQAARHGRPWLWLGLLGLALTFGAALLKPGRPQGRLLLLGGLVGAMGLAASGFLIGAKGWSLAPLNTAVGERGRHQFGVGWGGAVALTALVVLTAFGLARCGRFKGDLFTAAAVVGCGTLLAVFILFPVLKALSSAFLAEDASLSLAAMWERVASDRNFGLQCVLGGVRCGVAWNTLFLGLLTATSTTVLGTMMALMAERTGKRFGRALNILAMLPIITPPFVVGLGLILLFGRAGIVPVAGAGVRPGSVALVLRLVRRLDRPDFRLHADRLHDHAGCGAGRGPEPGGSVADLARQSAAHLHDDHVAAAHPGPGQCLPGWLHREHG